MVLGITISLSLALFTCMLFISLMESVNGKQFLNIPFLSLLPPPGGNVIAATVIFPLTSIYSSL